MARIYKGQNFRLTLTGGIDITGGSAKIQYRKSGVVTITEKTAVVSTPETAVCYYDFIPADNDVAGLGFYWLKLTTSDGKIYFGEPYELRIYNPGIKDGE